MSGTANFFEEVDSHEFWCPFARVASASDALSETGLRGSFNAANRLIDNASGLWSPLCRDMAGRYSAASCLGGACALWRWDDENKTVGHCGFSR